MEQEGRPSPKGHGSYNLGDVESNAAKVLTQEEKSRLEEQNRRMVSEFQALKLEREARKNWDLFYKRNEDRFFKDRHWTTREFEELLTEDTSSSAQNENVKLMLEIGCGVGNLIFPLIEDGNRNFFVYACDLSPRAIDLVKKHNLYDEQYMKAFTCDITKEEVFEVLPEASLDIATLIFVLSAIHPNNFRSVVRNVFRLMKPGGTVLFRDYGLYDMAQLRFKPGNKISENFYMRQDGTRSYYFAEDELSGLFQDAGFDVLISSYIHRRTINPKENIDVPRIFVQGKFRKPDK